MGAALGMMTGLTRLIVLTVLSVLVPVILLVNTDLLVARPHLNWTAMWHKCNEEMPEHGRVLVFSSCYPNDNPMRFRLVDAQFVKLMNEVELWMDCESSIYEHQENKHGC